MVIDERGVIGERTPETLISPSNAHYLGLGQVGMDSFSPLTLNPRTEALEADKLSLGYATSDDFADAASSLGASRTLDVRTWNAIAGRTARNVNDVRKMVQRYAERENWFAGEFEYLLAAFEKAENLAEFEQSTSRVVLIEGKLYEMYKPQAEPSKYRLDGHVNLDTLELYLEKTDSRDRKGIGGLGENLLREVIAQRRAALVAAD